MTTRARVALPAISRTSCAGRPASSWRNPASSIPTVSAVAIRILSGRGRRASGLSAHALHRRRRHRRRHDRIVSAVGGRRAATRSSGHEPSPCCVAAEATPQIGAPLHVTFPSTWKECARFFMDSAWLCALRFAPARCAAARSGSPHPALPECRIARLAGPRNGSAQRRWDSGVTVRLVQWSDRVGDLLVFGDR